MRRVTRRLRWLLVIGFVITGGFSVAAAHPAVDGTTVAADPIELADKVKLADFPRFSEILSKLDPNDTSLSDYSRWKLRYLLGWRAVYVGNYESARSLLDDVAENAPNNLLRFRALATLVNLLGEGHRYQAAFFRLSQLQDMMPSIRDANARFQGLGEASQLLSSAGQYDQAEAYARTMIDDPPLGQTVCKGAQHLLRAQRDAKKIGALDPMFNRAIDACMASGDNLFGQIMRGDVAWFYLEQGRAEDAIALLTQYGDAMRQLNYSTLSSEVDGTLARAYFRIGKMSEARRYANSAIAQSMKGEYTEALIEAYDVLYRVEKQAGNVAASLAYHEQYMLADKAYLTDVSARGLAFQMVDQQVSAKKAEVEALNKQNEILRLHSALDRKDVETGRLYIVILAAALAAIAWLVLWLRRSQMRFMKLARRDGLTGICNREHFVEQADRVLAYGARSDRGVCLILFDLDHFKSVNDTYGHAVGDEVLKRAVDVCHRALHACDVFGRLGGEEFAILLPDCSPAQARARAEQLRLSISATAATQARPELAVTASFGVASTLQCGFELHRLLVVADAALYRAKRAGRNCVFMGDTGDIPDSPYLTEARG
jgi:diguanylate cyclase (GGDEF)-like protein